MKLELVTAANIPILQGIMQDKDAVTYSQVPPCVLAENVYFLIKKDKDYVGYCDLHSIDMVSRSAWTAIYIRKQARTGMESAHNIYKELIEYAWQAMNLRKLYSDITSRPLGHWLKKIAWKQEGCLKQARYIDGRYVDQCVYALFRKE